MNLLIGNDWQRRVLAILILIFLQKGVNSLRNNEKIDYKNIAEEDYVYLTRAQVKNIEPLDSLIHLSRTHTPKYTVLLFNVFADLESVKKLSLKMYVHLVRHLDHYDTEFSDNVQFIVPNCYPSIRAIISLLGRKGTSALFSGIVPEDQYISLAAAAVAFINSLVRKGIIPSFEKSSIYGNCVGGIIGSAASLALKGSLGAVVLNGSALFMPEVVRRRLARKGALKSVKFLLIHSENDERIPYVHAENTLFSLMKWGVYARMFTVVDSDHLSTMIKYKYTGLRFIAAVLLSRVELFRPQDTENAELLQRTKKRMNREEIKSLVPHRTSSNYTEEAFLNIPVMQRIPGYEIDSSIEIKKKGYATYIFGKQNGQLL